MQAMADLTSILPLFGLQAADFSIERIGSGHIHQTYRLGGNRSFVLQRVNKNVFKHPELIASNLKVASAFLHQTVPNYLFVSCIKSVAGNEMEYDSEGYPWRLFPYLKNTITFDKVDSPEMAYEAAREFGRLSNYLDAIDTNLFQPTIPRFHDLSLRKDQFLESLANAALDRLNIARTLIQQSERHFSLVDEYERLIGGGSLRLRIVHNDTKINNVLFDRTTLKTVAVIDLDTLMPGYFIYDLGDMVRTFVCPVSEEEKDLKKILFRKEVYDGLLSGYLAEMGKVLSEAERRSIPFAGKMMTYIMALRFLADYLRGDTYYHITYPDQNLVRAANQLQLLQLIESELPG